MTASSSSTSPMSQHEQVVFCQDHTTGLRAIIGIYSTALGPALGGTRFYPYASEEAALADVLRLSTGMAYKNALAGLDLGGGKAVIIGDPDTDKTPELLRAYGRFVESLGGRYVTACDVGTYVADMDVVASEMPLRDRPTEANGGAGDSSVLTAYGVFQGMRACGPARLGQPTLAGRTVGVAGVGKVGRRLVGHLLEDGAERRRHRRQRDRPWPASRRYPQVEVVADTDDARRARTSTSTPPAPSAARSTTTPSGADREGGLWRGEQPARRRGRGTAPPTGSWRAASPTPPTSSSTPAGSSRSATSCTGSTSSAPARARRHLRHTPSPCCAQPTEGIPRPPPLTTSPRSGWPLRSPRLAARALSVGVASPGCARAG